MRCSIQNEIQNGGTESTKFTQLGERMEMYLLKSRSENTNSKYFSAFERWERFITLEGEKAVPATPIHVALYLTYLLDNESSCSVIQSAVYGIKWAHSLKGLHDPTVDSFVHNLVETAKRQPSQPKTKKGLVTTKYLIECCTKYKDSNDLTVVRDLSMITLCFSGFLFTVKFNLFVVKILFSCEIDLW